jgi:hypothetical protein
MESMSAKRHRPRRSFTAEFKAEIVDLCRRGDRSQRENDQVNHDGPPGPRTLNPRIARPPLSSSVDDIRCPL